MTQAPTKSKPSIKIPALPPHWHVAGCDCEPGVAYIRVSKVGNRQTIISPELQLDSIVNYAKANKIRLTAIITDINRSGKTFRKRSVDGIIANIKRGNYRRVVIWKWSRWARNVAESAKYLQLVRDVGGRVDSATEDHDQGSAVGRLQMDVLMRFDQYQSELIGETWNAVHERRAELGLPHAGRDRFGYQYVSEVVVTDGEKEKVDRYEVDKVPAAALKDAYLRYNRGASFKKIAPRLNAAGFRSSLGGLFTPQSVARMMDTGFAAGLIRERSKPTDKPSNSIRSYDKWRVGSHEPIIDAETWATYKARREAQADIPPRLRSAVHELSGMLFCAICKRRLVTKYCGANRKTHQWQCTWQSTYHPDVPVSVNNRLALIEVRDWVKRNAGPDGISEFMALANAGAATASAIPDERASIETERSRWQAKLTTLIEMRTDGEITKAEFEDRRREYDREIDRLSTRLAALPQPNAPADLKALETLDAEWDRFPTEKLHAALSAIIGMVVVSPRTDASTRKSAADRVDPIGAWESERLSRMQRSA